ncbi:hypothetical protein JXA32_07620 [Candidatus Sumerlaeota bacterium]|nr:hypothetical protein [Candidatus Sumerlaeota bacterium]
MYRDAFFGKDDLIKNRLRKIPLKSGLRDRLGRIASTVLLCGKTYVTIGEGYYLQIENKGQKRQLTVEYRNIDNWHAYCHHIGFSIRFSNAIKRSDGTCEHEGEIVIDPNVTFADIWSSDLDEFFRYCDHNSLLYLPGSTQGLPLTEDVLLPLYAKALACNTVKKLKESDIIDLSLRPVQSLSETEFGLLQVLWDTTKNFGFITGYGIVVGKTPINELKETSVILHLPVCGNIDGRGMVLWIEAQGIIFSEPDSEEINGFRVDKVINMGIELKDHVFRIIGFPELKICPEWAGIPLDTHVDQDISITPPDDWGVRMTYRAIKNSSDNSENFDH